MAAGKQIETMRCPIMWSIGPYRDRVGTVERLFCPVCWARGIVIDGQARHP